MWVKRALKAHCGKFGHFLSEEPPAPRLLSYEGRVTKKVGEEKKGKNSRPHCCSRPMRIAEPLACNRKRRKRKKREAESDIFIQLLPLSKELEGVGKRTGLMLHLRFLAVLPLLCYHKPQLFTNQEWAWKKNILHWFWQSLKSFNALWFVRWKRHFTCILTQFSHKVWGWKGQFVFESISLQLKCNLLIAFYYLLVLCCLSRVLHLEGFYWNNLQAILDPNQQWHYCFTDDFLYSVLMAVTL